MKQFKLPSIQNLASLRITQDLTLTNKIESSIEKYLSKKIIDKRKSENLSTSVDLKLSNHLGLLLTSQEQIATFGNLKRLQPSSFIIRGNYQTIY